MSRIAYLDCFSGASGDMVLGALLDAGLPLDDLRTALGSLALGDPAWSVEADRVDRSGVAATKFRLRERGAPEAPAATSDAHDASEQRHSHHHEHDAHDQVDAHPHDHDHGGNHGHHHPHRSLREIVGLIDQSALSASAKARAGRLFERLAEAEAAIHQMPVEEVHLHEVGALDSIIDIVGAVHGLEWLSADDIVASPLNVGSGTVRCAHGELSVPAPATARLLEGVPVYSSGVAAELVTPTGALLVTEFASSYGPLPAMRVDRIGYGAGDRDLPKAPNVLRLLVGESADAEVGHRVVVMECEIDDMNPDLFGSLMSPLYAGGALEVFYVPVQMKKNRPGTLVTVIAGPERRAALSEIVFRESTTIGLRYHEMTRECLERTSLPIETPIGTVRVKVARRSGRVVNAAPEFEDCARLAAEHGLSVKEVLALAQKAYLDRVSD